MARGRIITLDQQVTLELMNRVLAMCSPEGQTFSDLFQDPFIGALIDEHSERLVRDYILSMNKLGFIEKSSTTHVHFKTTPRGKKLAGTKVK